MHDLYTRQDLDTLQAQLNRRLIVIGLIALILFGLAVWSMIARVEWLTVVLVFLTGSVLIFSLELFCRPLWAYRRLLRSALGGRTHESVLVYDHTEPDSSLVDGVVCLSLIFLGEADKHGSREQLFYWDRQKEVPAFQSGEPVTLKYTGKMIIGYGTP